MIKRYLFVICFILTILTGCNLNNEKEHYLALSVDYKTKYTLHQYPWNSSLNYIEIKLDKNTPEVYLSYFLIPSCNSDIEVLSVESSNPEVISDEKDDIKIDTNSRLIKMIAKSTGEAIVTINSKKYGSATTIKIKIVK